MRRLLLGLGVVAAPLFALSGCASQGYGSGGGFEDQYDDCYDGYCIGYDAYGRVYERPKQPQTVARGDVDRIDRSHGTPQTVSRGGGRPASSSATPRMSVAPPASSRPAPTTASRP